MVVRPWDFNTDFHFALLSRILSVPHNKQLLIQTSSKTGYRPYSVMSNSKHILEAVRKLCLTLILTLMKCPFLSLGINATWDYIYLMDILSHVYMAIQPIFCSDIKD